VDKGPIRRERRDVARRAIGKGLLEQVSALADVILEEPAGKAAPLPDQTSFEDFKHDWLRDPMMALLRETDKLAAMDLEDDSKLGRHLRRRANNVALRAQRVAELVAFLRNLDSEFVKIARDAGCSAVAAVDCLFRSLTADDDAEAAEAAEKYRALLDEPIREDRLLLEYLPYATPEEFGFSELAETELTEILFGVGFDPSGRWHDTAAALSKQFDLFDLARKQLGYLDPHPHRDPAFGENYLQLATRLGASQFPVLAHRAAFLTTDLLERADLVDRAATSQLVGGFYMTEAPWIIESDSTYRPAMLDYLENDNRAAVLQALRALSEGVLRPYGSLLIALAAAAHGQRPESVTVESTLGTLADRFSSLTHPIFGLLRRFINPELRNADAHLRAAVGGSGELIVRKEDGSTAAVNANHVYGATTGLRSALDGVDAAVNLYFAREVVPTLDVERDRPGFISNEMLLLYARMAAGQYTSGTVAAVDAREGTLTVTFEGDGRHDQFESMLHHLIAVAPHFNEVVLVDLHGERIGVLAELNDEAAN
jgi:hypothetical protein